MKNVQIVRKLYHQRKQIEHILYRKYLYFLRHKCTNTSFLDYRKDFFIDWKNILLDKTDTFILWCFDYVWKSIHCLSSNDNHNFEISFTWLEEYQIIYAFKKNWLFQDFDMNKLLFSPLLPYVNKWNFLWLTYRLHVCYVEDRALFDDVLKKYWLYLYQIYTVLCLLIENFEELAKTVNYDKEEYFRLHCFKMSKYYFEEFFWYSQENNIITKQELDFFTNTRNNIFFDKITKNKIKIYHKHIVTKEELIDNFYIHSIYDSEKTRTYDFENYYQKKNENFHQINYWFQSEITEIFERWEKEYDWISYSKYSLDYSWNTIFKYLWLEHDNMEKMFSSNFIHCLWTLSDYKIGIDELKRYEKIQNESFLDLYWNILEALENIQFKERKFKFAWLVSEWKNTFPQYFFQKFIFREDRIINHFNGYFKWEDEDIKNAPFLWTDIFEFLWILSNKYEVYNQYLKLSLFYEFMNIIHNLTQSKHSVSQIMQCFIDYILTVGDMKMWSEKIYDKYKIRVEKLTYVLDEMSHNEIAKKIYWDVRLQDMTTFAKEYFQLYLEKILQLKNLFNSMNTNEKTNSTI